MTKQELRAEADRIAAMHGCEILPTANGVPALCVVPRYQQGDPQDGQLRTKCFNALRAAGINTDGWLS